MYVKGIRGGEIPMRGLVDMRRRGEGVRRSLRGEVGETECWAWRSRGGEFGSGVAYVAVMDCGERERRRMRYECILYNN